MNELRIRIVKVLPTGEKELYRNTVKYHDGVRFPFESVTETFKLLYPGCLIFFSQNLWFMKCTISTVAIILNVTKTKIWLLMPFVASLVYILLI